MRGRGATEPGDFPRPRVHLHAPEADTSRWGGRLTDSGLACHLLGIDTLQQFAKSPLRGALFEGLVASEILKWQIHSGGRREIYHFRDEQGLEVDFVVPGRRG